jgi:hypothetical protein
MSTGTDGAKEGGDKRSNQAPQNGLPATGATGQAAQSP